MHATKNSKISITFFAQIPLLANIETEDDDDDDSSNVSTVFCLIAHIDREKSERCQVVEMKSRLSISFRHKNRRVNNALSHPCDTHYHSNDDSKAEKKIGRSKAAKTAKRKQLNRALICMCLTALFAILS